MAVVQQLESVIAALEKKGDGHRNVRARVLARRILELTESDDEEQPAQYRRKPSQKQDSKVLSSDGLMYANQRVETRRRSSSLASLFAARKPRRTSSYARTSRPLVSRVTFTKETPKPKADDRKERLTMSHLFRQVNRSDFEGSADDDDDEVWCLAIMRRLVVGPLVFLVGHLYTIVVAPIFFTFRVETQHRWWHIANTLSEAACAYALYVASRPRLFKTHNDEPQHHHGSSQQLHHNNGEPTSPNHVQQHGQEEDHIWWRRMVVLGRFVDVLLTLPVWTLRLILFSREFHVVLSSISALSPRTTRRQYRRRYGVVSTVVDVIKVVQSVRLLMSYAVAADEKAMDHDESEFDPILVRIGKLALCFLAIIHYVCCVYHVLGKDVQEYDIDRELGYFSYYAVHNKGNVFHRWTESYYWAVSVILGNTQLPSTSKQASFHIFVFLLGITMTSTMTGSITSLLANADIATTRRRQRLACMKKFFKVYKVPHELATTIESYYRYLWRANYYDDKLFEDLTDALKLRLAIATKRKFIANCPIFKDLEQPMIVRLVTALVQKICFPDEVITAQNEIGTAMYFVAAGTLSVTVADAQTTIRVGILKPGDFFGEAALLSDNGRRTATVTADDFGELFVLNRNFLRVANQENENLRTIIATSIARRKKQTSHKKILHRVRRKVFCVVVFIQRLQELREVSSRRKRRSQRGSGRFLDASYHRFAGSLRALSSFPSRPRIASTNAGVVVPDDDDDDDDDNNNERRAEVASDE